MNKQVNTRYFFCLNVLYFSDFILITYNYLKKKVQIIQNQ
jgi:hypothetical protein